MKFQGYVEEIRSDFVRGWAASIDAAPLTLDLIVDDVIVATTVTRVRRGDVARKLGLNENTGFEFHLDVRKRIAAASRVKVVLRNLAAELPYTGSLLASRAIKAAPVSAPAETTPTILRPLPAPHLAWELDGSWICGRAIAWEGRLILVTANSREVGRFTVHAQRVGEPYADFFFKLPQHIHTHESLAIALIDGLSGRVLQSNAGAAAEFFSSPLFGEIDTIHEGSLTGWVQAPSGQSVTLTLMEAGQILKVQEMAPSAHEERHPFELAIPVRCFTATPSRFALMIRAGESELEITLPGQRYLDLTLDPAELARSSARYRGKVEHVSPQVISGWVVDRNDPFKPVDVEIFLDDLLVGSARADLYRPRLRVLGGVGEFAFTFLIPVRLWDGRPHRLSFRAAGASAAISGMSAEIRFPYRIAHTVRRVLPYQPVPRPSPAANPGLVSIVVINQNGAELLEAFLASLCTHAPRDTLEVIVIDHGSVDTSAEAAARYADRLDICYIARNKNFSFSESNNLGASRASGEFVLFINNDIELTGDIIGLLRAHFVADETGMVGARLFEPRSDGENGVRLHLHHDQVGFRVSGHQPPMYEPYEVEADLAHCSAAASEVTAVTAALMMMRRADFLALGGFDETYFYGLEDIDLCLRLRRELGKRVVIEHAAVALHKRGATRGRRIPSVAALPKADDLTAANRLHFQNTHAAAITRFLREALLDGSAPRAEPFRIGFAVTSIDLDTAAGDTFTATELAEACHSELRWETALLRHDEVDATGLDAYVAMRHDAPVRMLSGANPGLVNIAWIRNRADEWIASETLDCFHILLASSQKIADALHSATGREAIVFPIAANTDRFNAHADDPRRRQRVVFTGNFWGDSRNALLEAQKAGVGKDVAIYGHGWDRAVPIPEGWRGARRYVDLPSVYARAQLVLDDGHPVASAWNSLNSRVFDALASGALVLTNAGEAAHELFGATLPSFNTAHELSELLHRFAAAPDERIALATTLQAQVRQNHSYRVRAQRLHAALKESAKSLSIAIKCPVPRAAERPFWGDWHFARGLQKALVRLGHPTRIDILPEWNSGLDQGDDVTITLRGLSQYHPLPNAINLIWIISHPHSINLDELRSYHHTIVASASFTESLRREGIAATPLLQCTDPDLFKPPNLPWKPSSDVLFVGNSRGQRRQVVDDAIAAGLEPHIYGQAWRGLISEHFLRGEHIPNAELSTHYAKALAVLNDHWPDMRASGFLSNRLFDAAASGAAIITDNVAELEAIFGDDVLVYRSADDLPKCLEVIRHRDQTRPRWRDELARRIRQDHSFDNRAVILSAKIKELAAARALKPA